MNKYIIAVTVMCCAFAVALPLYGQQQKEYTLGNLWPKVKEKYPGVGVENSAVEAAKLNERAVKSGMLPQLKAQAQTTYGTFEGSVGAFFPQPGFFNVNGSGNSLNGSNMAANSFGSTTIDWELFSFGRLRKENDAAKALSSKSMSEKDAYLLNLKKLLSERYISLLYNEAKLNWTEANVQRLNDIRKTTSGLSASGLKPAADSLLASSSYIQSLGENDKWKGYREAAFIKLLELNAGDTINYIASAYRFSNQERNNLNFNNRVDPSHPILSALDKQAQFFALSGKAQKRASLPSLHLLGGYAFRGSGINSTGTESGAWSDGFNNGAKNFLVGVGVTWNITSLRTNYFKGEELLKEAESQKLLYSQYELAMQADLTASQAKIFQQSEQLQKTRLSVNQSQDAYNMYLARYKSGLITLSELLQVRTLLEQAENNHIEASREYWMLLAYEAELTADFDYLFNNL